MNGFFLTLGREFLHVAETPLETNANLLVKHGVEQTYQKSKKVKESLSSFLPYLPGKITSSLLHLPWK